MTSTKELINFAEKLADVSGDIVKKYFRINENIKAEIKLDKSPVTAADMEIERELSKLIKATYPTHGIIGEEYGNHNIASDYNWVIDPIDGTLSFLIGRPIFGTLIALCYKNKPIIGIINQPINNERWLGVSGQYTKFNNQIIKLNNNNRLSDAIICTTSDHLLNEQAKTLYLEISNIAKHKVYGGDCYNYGLLALGSVDVIIETGLKVFDYCALVPVIEAAGGIITDFNGRSLDLNSDGSIIAAANKEIHKEILERLRNGK